MWRAENLALRRIIVFIISWLVKPLLCDLRRNIVIFSFVYFGYRRVHCLHTGILSLVCL